LCGPLTRVRFFQVFPLAGYKQAQCMCPHLSFLLPFRASPVFFVSPLFLATACTICARLVSPLRVPCFYVFTSFFTLVGPAFFPTSGRIFFSSPQLSMRVSSLWHLCGSAVIAGADCLLCTPLPCLRPQHPNII